ncbi:MAG TPA: hypothetical protein VK206_04625 [Anaerolineales bacterium]|nr:hypothetical protein [Anaerolineales bacterium]
MEAQYKSRFKWVKRIAIILFAALLYAVYFTELGKPPPKNESPMTFYNQTAVPTIFAQWSPVPTVELDWAYASQNLLKIAIKIHNLERNMDPVDWICDPYIRIDKPVAPRPSGRQITPVYDASGEAIQIIYDYEIHASKYDSLTIDMDTTVGPCADHLNPREFNMTTFELVGNYHLSFQVPVKTSTPLPPKNTPAVTVWNGIPIYPGANELREDEGFYVYIVQDTAENIEAFYGDKMTSDGWELFNRSNMTINNRQGVDLYYSKSERIIMISILLPIEDELTTVSVNLVQ